MIGFLDGIADSAVNLYGIISGIEVLKYYNAVCIGRHRQLAEITDAHLNINTYNGCAILIDYGYGVGNGIVIGLTGLVEIVNIKVGIELAALALAVNVAVGVGGIIGSLGLISAATCTNCECHTEYAKNREKLNQYGIFHISSKIV